MKLLHRPDLFSWSSFDTSRNVDFHGLAWIRPGGNVLVDPLPMIEHDLAHLTALGGAKLIVITNSDHTRAAQALAERFAAELCGPAGERESFPLQCARWLCDGEEVVPGLRVRELRGSKTPGELALVLEETTLITGDMVRAHQAGRLNLLPDAKLKNREEALASVARLGREHPQIDAVLVGDGWPVFRDGLARLRELA
jgi:glyoxylase-like metal-dependent hydrolase (beta-lactamase superfamily II)